MEVHLHPPAELPLVTPLTIRCIHKITNNYCWVLMQLITASGYACIDLINQNELIQIHCSLNRTSRRVPPPHDSAVRPICRNIELAMTFS